MGRAACIMHKGLRTQRPLIGETFRFVTFAECNLLVIFISMFPCNSLTAHEFTFFDDVLLPNWRKLAAKQVVGAT